MRAAAESERQRHVEATVAHRPAVAEDAFTGLKTDMKINHLVAMAANVSLIAPISGGETQGLNSREIRSLGLIYRLGPKTVRQLARVSDQDPANVSRSMTMLLDKGLIVKSDNPKHRQSQVISLTSTGEKLYNRLRLKIEERATALLGDFTNEDKDDFVRLLERYLHNGKGSPSQT